MEKIKIEYSHKNAIANITLDDGKGNVLDRVMVGELQQLLTSFEYNYDIKLIIFQGAGKHFSFGASVEEHQKEFAGGMLREFHRLFYTIRDLAIPCAAKISGQCLGGGLELALMCNMMFADKTAKMGQPEISLGVIAPAGSVLLPEKIGYARAEELLLTGRSMATDEAMQIGLLNAVYEDKAEMDKAVLEWVEKYIVPKSASSLRFAVRAARVRFNQNFTNLLSHVETMYVGKLMDTADANEGIKAFLEKREAAYINS